MKKSSRQRSLGSMLVDALEEGVAVAEGRKAPVKQSYKEFTVPPKWTPEKIKKLRKQLSLSQATLARVLFVKTETISAWEQGVNTPNGAARRALQFLQIDPLLIMRVQK